MICSDTDSLVSPSSKISLSSRFFSSLSSSRFIDCSLSFSWNSNLCALRSVRSSPRGPFSFDFFIAAAMPIASLISARAEGRLASFAFEAILLPKPLTASVAASAAFFERISSMRLPNAFCVPFSKLVSHLGFFRGCSASPLALAAAAKFSIFSWIPPHRFDLASRFARASSPCFCFNSRPIVFIAFTFSENVRVWFGGGSW